MAQHRKIDNRIIHRLALECIADQVETIIENSEYEGERIRRICGTDDDEEALRKAMIRICDQLRRRSEKEIIR